jgi:HK97 family phage prohead protease
MAVEFKRARASQSGATVDEDNRLIKAWATLPVVDLADEVVIPDGVELEADGRIAYYSDTRAVFWNHLYDVPPIGTMRAAALVKKKPHTRKSLRFVWYQSKGTQLARDLFELVREGVVRGVSIGFEAKEFGPPTKAEIEEFGPHSTTVRKYRLREVSLTPMPANPAALIEQPDAKVDESQAVRLRSLVSRGTISDSWLDEFRVSSTKTISTPERRIIVV